ncbi:DUF3127 domain-containing protein [Leyella stercorea]|jgi:hypothetical protein|uniref:DUF3127 domain-containing protein n=1 Tax=Leyella stercorea TaxID=363265 RepID=UPI00243287F8|nr:DUF3127 domain-containing protein [Leyella stercorea]
MELQGKVIAVLPERSGVSARGEWKSQDYVIETHDQYPRKMVFGVFGADRISRFNIQVGQEVTVSFDIDAHEYQGRWFNNIRAFDVRQVDPATVGAAQAGIVPGAVFGAAPAPQPAAPQPTAPAPEADPVNDLPF